MNANVAEFFAKKDPPGSRGNLYSGVTFATLRTAIVNMYFVYDGISEELVKEAFGYVLPMQHNVENPLQAADAKDTFIEYWIDYDDRNSPDIVQGGPDGTGQNIEFNKVARVSLRFVGSEAEIWAKAFHHITKRDSVATIFWTLCNAKILEYVEPIRPIVVDYFKPANSSIAFDLSFKLVYNESMELNWQSLNLVVLGPGLIEIGS